MSVVLLTLAALMLGGRASAEARPAPGDGGRERINIDQGWRFAHGHASDAQRDFGHGLRPFFFAKAGYGDGPASADFSDLAWRKVDLPHDWAVELPFDARGNANHGSRAIGRNFPENSVGWYRKVVHLPEAARGCPRPTGDAASRSNSMALIATAWCG